MSRAHHGPQRVRVDLKQQRVVEEPAHVAARLPQHGVAVEALKVLAPQVAAGGEGVGLWGA